MTPYTPQKTNVCVINIFLFCYQTLFFQVLIDKEHAVFEAFVKMQKVLAAHSLSAMTYSGKPSEFIHNFHLFLLTRFTTCIFLSYTVDRDIAHQSIVSVPCEDGDRHEDIVVSKAKQHLKVSYVLLTAKSFYLTTYKFNDRNLKLLRRVSHISY